MANVPNVPGVPPLSNYISGAVTLLAKDALDTLLDFLRPQWGIYIGGVPAVPCENVVSVDFRQDWNISDYPVEEGGFQSYNKVTNPFSVRLRLSTGSVLQRAAMLEATDALCQSLTLVDVVTPDAIYTDVNLAHYDYRRSAQQGLGLLMVDIWAMQVRVDATSTFTKSASSSDIKNVGNVNAEAPTQTQELSAARRQ